MKYNNSKKRNVGGPILDFISGNTNTKAAKRLTKNIGSLQSLWQLAKMAAMVKKCSKD